MIENNPTKDKEVLAKISKTWIKKGERKSPATEFGYGNKGHLGHKHSDESRNKMSIAAKGRTPWNKGLKGYNSGEKNCNWKGGISSNKRKLNTLEYRDWRLKVFTRDNWICQDCGIRGGDLEAHHKKRWVDYPDLRFNVENGQTLCKKCHNKTKTYQ